MIIESYGTLFADSFLTTYQRQFELLSCAVVGAAVGWFTYRLVQLMFRPKLVEGEQWNYDQRRKSGIESQSSLHRYFGPLIDDLTALNTGRIRPEKRAQIAYQLALSNYSLLLTPEEFLATKQFQAIVCALGTVLGGYLLFGSGAGWFFGPILGYGLYTSLLSDLASKTEQRKYTILRRLPYCMDLLTLTMQAGATFLDALRTVVRENADHPLGDEFGRVILEIDRGRTRREALEGLENRIREESVTELINAITNGEQMGTPLADIFRNQADQMRLKRSQWVEKSVADAQVKLTFPGMVIMVACLLVVLAPILFRALNSFSDN